MFINVLVVYYFRIVSETKPAIFINPKTIKKTYVYRHYIKRIN